jgi:DNA-binding transcriptional ArsR family regulator
MKEIHLTVESAKALAHPLRMRIVGSLRLDGPATASMLAERLAVSSGLTSYHVRRLADAGFVEPDDGQVATGRERWWRAAHDMTTWRAGDLDADADARATEQWLQTYAARHGIEQLDDWIRRRPEADPAWREATTISDYVLELTPDELRALEAEIDAVIARRLDREPDADPARAQVVLLLSTFPRADPAR